jgi:hypothetical protein
MIEGGVVIDTTGSHAPLGSLVKSFQYQRDPEQL